MNVLHLWAIPIGIAAACLPVLIHWLTRPRPRRLPISTLRFIRAAVEQKRSRSRLRDFIVLTLRTLAVLLLAWAIARPLSDARIPPSEAGEGNTSRVVLLDVSQSMAAGDHGIQAIERARAAAAGYLEFRPGLRVNLILAGAAPHAVFEQPSANYTALREELARCTPRPERLDLKAALDLSAEMLSKASGQSDAKTELIVVSDFQRSNWAAADFSSLPKETRIQLESVTPVETPANLAITRVSWQGRGSLDQEVSLQVEVGNFSATPQTVQVEVEAGSATYRLEGPCAAQTRTTLSTPVVLRSLGWQVCQARLVGVHDALESDNIRPAVLEVRRAPAYALVTRQAAGERIASSHYLEVALTLLMRGEKKTDQKLTRLDPVQIDRESLAAAELIVFDHPGKLSAEAISLTASLLRRGRALLYVAAEPIDATNLKLLAESAGSDLRMPVEFLPPPGGQSRRDLFLAEVRREQQPFSIFGEQFAAMTGSLRFGGGLASRRIEGALDEDVLATYSDRSACLVVAPCGAGTLAVLNANLDSSASTLAVSTAFVPLLAELTERLLSRSVARGEVNSGEPLAVYLPAEAGPAAGLRIVAPGATDQSAAAGETVGDGAGELIDEGPAALWRLPAAGPPGAYRVQRDDNTVFLLASVTPAEESDLQSLSADVFKDRLSGGRQIHYRSTIAAGDDRDDAWVWLIVACVGCMLAEWIALRIFRT